MLPSEHQSCLACGRPMNGAPDSAGAIRARGRRYFLEHVDRDCLFSEVKKRMLRTPGL